LFNRFFGREGAAAPFSSFPSTPDGIVTSMHSSSPCYCKKPEPSRNLLLFPSQKSSFPFSNYPLLSRIPHSAAPFPLDRIEGIGGCPRLSVCDLVAGFPRCASVFSPLSRAPSSVGIEVQGRLFLFSDGERGDTGRLSRRTRLLSPAAAFLPGFRDLFSFPAYRRDGHLPSSSLRTESPLFPFSFRHAPLDGRFFFWPPGRTRPTPRLFRGDLLGPAPFPSAAEAGFPPCANESPA